MAQTNIFESAHAMFPSVHSGRHDTIQVAFRLTLHARSPGLKGWHFLNVAWSVIVRLVQHTFRLKPPEEVVNCGLYSLTSQALIDHSKYQVLVNCCLVPRLLSNALGSVAPSLSRVFSVPRFAQGDKHDRRRREKDRERLEKERVRKEHARKVSRND